MDSTPIEVTCGMRLLDINEIDSVHGSFSVNVAFYFSWVDNRIEVLDPNATTANVDNDFLKHIWTPDFYIYDLQRFRPQGVLSNGGGLRMKKLDNNNTGSLIDVYVLISSLFYCRNLL